MQDSASICKHVILERNKIDLRTTQGLSHGYKKIRSLFFTTGRIRQLAERYAITLPQITDDVEKLAARVERHLERMGFKS